MKNIFFGTTLLTGLVAIVWALNIGVVTFTILVVFILLCFLFCEYN